MNRTTAQMKKWAGEFGREYTDRNCQTLEEMKLQYEQNYGLTPEQMFLPFLKSLDRSSRILEIGCNVGTKLLFLQSIGFESLHGIELQDYASGRAKSTLKRAHIIQGSALDIPYKDNCFDLVFTAGVLIHIAPSDIHGVLSEIYRVTKKYIWGLEYYADHYVEVSYRGNSELLWKTDFAQLYLENFKNLNLVKEERFKYLQNENVDTIYLLEKRD